MSGTTNNSETRFQCSECSSVQRDFYGLRKHVKKFHPLKLNEIAPLTKHRANLQSKTLNFVCDMCGKKFTYKKHLTFHKKSHGISNDVQSKTFNFLCDICGRKFTYKKHLTFHKKSHGISNDTKFSKKCPLCTFTGCSKTQLHNHFRQIHDIDLCFETLEFSTAQSFHTWKSSMENDTKSLFVKECGDEHSNNHSKKILRYVCHRSGFYVPEGQQKRHLKIQGSKKIGGFCPAGCKVVVNSDGKYNVSYIKTHVGHTDELGHLTLTTAERREIATKIAMKIPFSDILDEIRDRLCDNSVKRIHLLTNKDLNNIAASFNLQSEAVRHSNDAISIEAWVNDIQQGQSVLLPSDSMLENQEENDVNNLHIHVNPKNQETEDIYNCLVASSNSRHDGKQLHQMKEKMKRWFCSIVDSVQSDEEFDVLTKLTAPIEPTLNATVIKSNFALSEKIASVPHNKKIDPQRRLFSTRKQTKKSGKWKKPSTQTRNQIAASLLNNNSMNTL